MLKDKQCDAIINLQTPKSVKDCRSFCGMVNFLSSFLKDLRKHLIPIYGTQKKKCKFEWTKVCQIAFDNIKQLLTNSPGLCMQMGKIGL